MRMSKNIAGLTMAGLVLVLSGETRAEIPTIYNATLGETNQKTQEVSTEQMRRILSEGTAVVLDTRSRAEFNAGHIPGAHCLDAAPSEQISAVERLVNGDKSKAIVLYCNGPYCQASRRLADTLAGAGFTRVSRYQLGLPIWRALGGPTEIEAEGVARVMKADRSAVFIDARSPQEFSAGTLPSAQNAPVEEVMTGKMKKMPLPEDDLNRRIILFGRDTSQARLLAEFMSKRPWHNVAYFSGSFEKLKAGVAE